LNSRSLAQFAENVQQKLLDIISLLWCETVRAVLMRTHCTSWRMMGKSTLTFHHWKVESQCQSLALISWVWSLIILHHRQLQQPGLLQSLCQFICITSVILLFYSA